MKPLNDTTFAVNTVGNTQALLLCLSSVINATQVPRKIRIRSEGHFPSTSGYYLEQLMEFARWKGVETSITVDKSKGVRYARDWQIDNCTTRYLWMGDDDVVYHYECLENLYGAMMTIHPKARDEVAYLCGSKADLNNRRNYPNWNTSLQGADKVKEDCPFFYSYDVQACAGKIAKMSTMDTGNCFLNIPLLRKHGIRFTLYDDSVNCGGEDTLFAMECANLKLQAYFVPSAQSYHLEKENLNFSEFAARAEMILRVAHERKYPAEVVNKVKAAHAAWGFSQK